MKATLITCLIFFATILSAQRMSQKEASQLLGRNFVSIQEAKNIFPELPKLKIPFTRDSLLKYPDFYLIPIESNGKYRYFLVKTFFDFENTREKQSLDTLEIKEAKRAIYLLTKLRPEFQGNNLDKQYKFFIKSKTPSDNYSNYKQSFSYNGRYFLLLDWPAQIAYGEINPRYATFFLYKNQQEHIGFVPLPSEPKIKEEHPIRMLYILYRK